MEAQKIMHVYLSGKRLMPSHNPLLAVTDD